MFKTLYSRMLAAYLTAVIAIIAALGFVSASVFRNRYMNTARMNLVREAEEIDRIVREEYMDKAKRTVASEKILAIVRQLGAFLQLYFDDGTLGVRRFYDYKDTSLWSSYFDANFFEMIELNTKDEKPPDVTDGTHSFYSDVLGSDRGVRTMSVVRLLSATNGQSIGRLVLHYDMTDIYSALDELYFDIFAIVAAAVLISGTITIIITRNMTRPLSHITEVVRAFSMGQHDARVAFGGKDELAALGASFNEMADKVGRLERTRREFVANVSHELRSPLTSMRGFLEAMEEGVIPPDEHEKYIGVVLDENKRMASIVNDLLDIARIESGHYKLSRSTFDVSELIGRTLVAFEGRIESGGILVNAQLPDTTLFVNADRERIGQVLHNLIDNAIKFMPETGGRLSVSVNSDRHQVRVTVADNGKGIPKEDIPHVFDRFYKVEKAHTYSAGSGTGLGLSIVKLIIDQHGESISAECENGETRFSFTLKRVSAPRHTQA